MSRLTKNIFYNLGGQGLLLLLSFTAVQFVFSRLGSDPLGILYFTLAVGVILSTVLDLGLSFTLVREISRNPGDKRYLKSLISTVSSLYWGIYIILGIVVLFLSPFIVKSWINLTLLDIDTAILSVRILLVTSLMTLPKSLYISLLRGIERMEFSNIIEVVIAILQQVGVIILVSLGRGLIDISYWIGFSSAVGLLILSTISSHFFPLTTLIPGWNFEVLKKNFKYSFNLMLITSLSTIHIQTDKMTLSKLLPIGLVGFYGLTFHAITRGALIAKAVGQASFPVFSRFVEEREDSKLLEYYWRLQDLVCISTFPILASIPFILEPVFTFLFTKEVAQSLLGPAILVSIGTYMNSTLNIPYTLSLAKGRPDITVRLNFYALFTVLPLTILLIYLFGLLGAGTSWILYHILAYSYVIPRICKECLHLSVIEWYTHILKITSIGICSYGLAYLTLSSQGTLALIVGYIMASLVFLICSYMIATPELRNSFKAKLAEVL